MPKDVLPLSNTGPNYELHRKISRILMDFVCHNQKPFSKKLNNFIATGCHDIRAGNVSIDILRLVQEHLDKE